MPQNPFYRSGAGSQPAAPPSGNPFYRSATPAPPAPEDYTEPEVVDTEFEAEEDESGPGVGTALAGAAGVGGLAALLAKAPGTIGRLAKGANSLRSQLMLTGFALPKSVLGNIGATVERSIETGSMRPLRELLSMQTLRDAGTAWKAGGLSSGVRGADEAIGQSGNALTRAASVVSPGRVMGSFDEATQGALRRSGATADEAANATLQTPLGANFGKLGEALDSPPAQYLHPFRRTPFNQFIEGLKKYQTAWQGDRASQIGLGLYSGAGAAHGALTAEDGMPVSVPLATAASARYGLPYAVAALVGRGLAGGKGGGGIAGSALPVSEYGYEQAATDPLKPFRKPAAVAALERLTGRQ